MEAAMPAEQSLVLVEYGFEYRAKDGTLVSIKPNERYVLLKRTNPHWWHVRRSGDARPFYIPAQYVKELPPITSPALLDPLPSGHVATEPAMLIPQHPPAYEYRFIGAAEPGEPAGGCQVLHTVDDVGAGDVVPVMRVLPTAGDTGIPSSDLSVSPQAHKDSEEPPDPIYLNIQELREEAAATSSIPEEPGGSVSDWETHTDTESGHLFYYNPVTGETTWQCPFGRAADTGSATASPASSLAHSPEFPAWEQHVDEGSGQTFFYNSVTGETSWDPPSAGDTGSPQDMYPGAAPYDPTEQRVSTQRGAGLGMGWGRDRDGDGEGNRNGGGNRDGSNVGAEMEVELEEGMGDVMETKMKTKIEMKMGTEMETEVEVELQKGM
ncbi:hypothetical protein WISP_13640 [Willisornis vidua]|uniref:RHG27 protein n=1 Tax=Willisornis vidua TaxID=1566151 RepID=A0ABQ9DR46_9PASS|nr:hypothetical protein WISP_13640 [Willisornis vidua]